MKIPVAIKVLREATSPKANQEILDVGSLICSAGVGGCGFHVEGGAWDKRHSLNVVFSSSTLVVPEFLIENESERKYQNVFVSCKTKG